MTKEEFEEKAIQSAYDWIVNHYVSVLFDSFRRSFGEEFQNFIKNSIASGNYNYFCLFLKGVHRVCQAHQNFSCPNKSID